MNQTTHRAHLVIVVRDAILRVDADRTMFGLSPLEATVMAEAAVEDMMRSTTTGGRPDPIDDVSVFQDAWDNNRRG